MVGQKYNGRTVAHTIKCTVVVVAAQQKIIMLYTQPWRYNTRRASLRLCSVGPLQILPKVNDHGMTLSWEPPPPPGLHNSGHTYSSSGINSTWYYCMCFSIQNMYARLLGNKKRSSLEFIPYTLRALTWIRINSTLIVTRWTCLFFKFHSFINSTKLFVFLIV